MMAGTCVALLADRPAHWPGVLALPRPPCPTLCPEPRGAGRVGERHRAGPLPPCLQPWQARRGVKPSLRHQADTVGPGPPPAPALPTLIGPPRTPPPAP